MSNEELVEAIKSGQKNLTKELWLQIEKFVRMQANKFWHTRWQNRCRKMHIDIDDLYQVGYFAMLDTIDKYDSQVGAKFLTFFGYDLNHWFMKTIKMTMRSGCWYGSADALERAKSIDSQAYSDNEDITIAETVPDKNAELAFEELEEEIDRTRCRKDLEAAIALLEPKEARIIRNYYFRNIPLAKQAEAIGLSRTRCNTIRQNALKKLKVSNCLRLYRRFREQMLETYACAKGSFNAWKYNGSLQERYVIRLDDYEHYLHESSKINSEKDLEVERK